MHCGLRLGRAGVREEVRAGGGRAGGGACVLRQLLGEPRFTASPLTFA